MRASGTAKLAAGLLVVGLAGMAGAQRIDVAQGHTQRAIDTASGVQDRSSRAQERASAAQERAATASEAAGRASGAASRGLDIGSISRARGTARWYVARFEELVRANRDQLELVGQAAAVRSEVVAVNPTTAGLEAARKHGYQVMADEVIEGLDTRYVTLRVPRGRPLERALAQLRRVAPDVEFAANFLHLQSGTADNAGARSARLAPSTPISGPAIGIIDSGVAASGFVPMLMQRGFAAGAPAPSAHGTAVASLAAGVGRVRSGSPGAPLLVADVYGSDARGGNSLALAKALGWMAQRKVPVVLIGLVGPPSPIVASAIRQVQARGMFVVAPAGNAGAAAPPMFPAAYSGVIAVTGVDSKNRALIEAGRGPHLDYAAPGADIVAAGPGGRLMKVRGTSYAAPLVAGRLWLASRSGSALSVLDREAVDLGRSGPDPIFGRGLICGKCR